MADVKVCDKCGTQLMLGYHATGAIKVPLRYLLPEWIGPGYVEVCAACHRVIEANLRRTRGEGAA